MSKTMKIVLIVLLVLVLACGGVVIYLMNSLQTGTTQTAQAPEDFFTQPENPDELAVHDEDPVPEPAADVVTLEADVTPMPIYETEPTSEDIVNILLVGADSREAPDTAQGRSDTIMVASYNRVANKMYIISFMRDSQVIRIGERSKFKGRLNAAYNGGIGELINTLNLNFDLNLQNYMSIGFEGLWILADGLNGVELETTAEEAYFSNWRCAQLLKADDKRNYKEILEKTGRQILKDDETCTQVLRGEAFVWYCRDRYSDYVDKNDGTVIKGGDAARIARQQYAITQMFKQITEDMDWNAMLGLYQYASLYMSTNMDLGTVIDLGAAVYNKKPEMEFIRVPEKYSQAKDKDGNETTMLAFDIDDTKEALHQLIYAGLPTPTPDPDADDS